MTPIQKHKLEDMFINAVKAYLNPILEADKAANKMVADQMKDVLFALDYAQHEVLELIKKANND